MVLHILRRPVHADASRERHHGVRSTGARVLQHRRRTHSAHPDRRRTQPRESRLDRVGRLSDRALFVSRNHHGEWPRQPERRSSHLRRKLLRHPRPQPVHDEGPNRLGHSDDQSRQYRGGRRLDLRWPDLLRRQRHHCPLRCNDRSRAQGVQQRHSVRVGEDELGGCPHCTGRFVALVSSDRQRRKRVLLVEDGPRRKSIGRRPAPSEHPRSP